jgi:hypothetical protein
MTLRSHGAKTLAWAVERVGKRWIGAVQGVGVVVVDVEGVSDRRARCNGSG